MKSGEIDADVFKRAYVDGGSHEIRGGFNPCEGQISRENDEGIILRKMATLSFEVIDCLRIGSGHVACLEKACEGDCFHPLK